MALHGCGSRDPARVLKFSPTTVIENLKKVKSTPQSGARGAIGSMGTESNDGTAVPVGSSQSRTRRKVELRGGKAVATLVVARR